MLVFVELCEFEGGVGDDVFWVKIVGYDLLVDLIGCVGGDEGLGVFVVCGLGFGG